MSYYLPNEILLEIIMFLPYLYQTKYKRINKILYQRIENYQKFTILKRILQSPAILQNKENNNLFDKNKNYYLDLNDICYLDYNDLKKYHLDVLQSDGKNFARFLENIYYLKDFNFWMIQYYNEMNKNFVKELNDTTFHQLLNSNNLLTFKDYKKNHAENHDENYDENSNEENNYSDSDYENAFLEEEAGNTFDFLVNLKINFYFAHTYLLEDFFFEFTKYLPPILINKWSNIYLNFCKLSDGAFPPLTDLNIYLNNGFTKSEIIFTIDGSFKTKKDKNYKILNTNNYLNLKKEISNKMNISQHLIPNGFIVGKILQKKNGDINFDLFLNFVKSETILVTDILNFKTQTNILHILLLNLLNLSKNYLNSKKPIGFILEYKKFLMNEQTQLILQKLIKLFNLIKQSKFEDLELFQFCKIYEENYKLTVFKLIEKIDNDLIDKFKKLKLHINSVRKLIGKELENFELFKLKENILFKFWDENKFFNVLNKIQEEKKVLFSSLNNGKELIVTTMATPSTVTATATDTDTTAGGVGSSSSDNNNNQQAQQFNNITKQGKKKKKKKNTKNTTQVKLSDDEDDYNNDFY
ncbi:hypothetical protein ABK040_009191 [Willaertia magna]